MTKLNKQTTDPKLRQTAVSRSVTKKELNVTVWKDSVSCRSLNKQISIHKHNGGRNEIVFVRMAENQTDLETPSCKFEIIKGKVCITRLALSNKGLEALNIAISHYLQNVSLTDG